MKFNIDLVGVSAVIGALSWVPILLRMLKKRKVKTSLIHCRFFDKFSINIIPPDYLHQFCNNPDVKFNKYEGSLIVIGINICSVNKDFVIEQINAKILLDKSEHKAILISPDVLVDYPSKQDQTIMARLSIPSSLDASKMKNIKSNINTRLYMAFVCKDVFELKYEAFKSLEIDLIDINNKKFTMVIDKKQIDEAALISDRDIYDVDYLAKIGNRKLIETLSHSPEFIQKIFNKTDETNS